MGIYPMVIQLQQKASVELNGLQTNSIKLRAIVGMVDVKWNNLKIKQWDYCSVYFSFLVSALLRVK